MMGALKGMEAVGPSSDWHVPVFALLVVVFTEPTFATSATSRKLPANGSSVRATFSRPASTPDRLIIDLYGSSCCDTPELLTDEEVAHAPPALAARGIDDATW